MRGCQLVFVLFLSQKFVVFGWAQRKIVVIIWQEWRMYNVFFLSISSCFIAYGLWMLNLWKLCMKRSTLYPSSQKQTHSPPVRWRRRKPRQAHLVYFLVGAATKMGTDAHIQSSPLPLRPQIREEIEQYGIKIYQFPDCDSDEDEDFKQQDAELKVRPCKPPVSPSASPSFKTCMGWDFHNWTKRRRHNA